MVWDSDLNCLSSVSLLRHMVSSQDIKRLFTKTMHTGPLSEDQTKHRRNLQCPHVSMWGWIIPLCPKETSLRHQWCVCSSPLQELHFPLGASSSSLSTQGTFRHVLCRASRPFVNEPSFIFIFKLMSLALLLCAASVSLSLPSIPSIYLSIHLSRSLSLSVWLVVFIFYFFISPLFNQVG